MEKTAGMYNMGEDYEMKVKQMMALAFVLETHIIEVKHENLTKSETVQR